MTRWVTVVILMLAAHVARAQGTPVTSRRDSTARDTTARDSTARDTALVHWAPSDSTMEALLARTGYNATRYQGDTATFDADQRVLDLLPAKGTVAAVKRGTQTVVSDSAIFYSEKAHSVTVGGNYVLSDPSSHQADVRGAGVASYNLAQRYARVTNARFTVDNGQSWYLTTKTAALVGDSTSAAGMQYYARGGTLTSCSDSIPDYYFSYSEAKRTRNTLVVAPAVMYVKDIPILWLPFMFTDSRPGRHSGVLTPRFGVSDIIRNNPGYHRDVEHVGYYWAPSDYMGFQTWLDWRSGTGAQQQVDPGWTRINGEWDYAWLNRFVNGSLASSYLTQNDGHTNTAVTWLHNQQFPGLQSSLTADVNYVTSTTLQRQNTFNPAAALATITSSVNYQERFGPTSVTLGGTRMQFPGRQQVNQTAPTFSLSTSPISLAGGDLVWTPGINYTMTQSLHLDQPNPLAFRFFTGANGARDSVATDQQSATSTLSFQTPLKIFGYNLDNSFTVNQRRNGFPVTETFYDMFTGDSIGSRVFASQYQTEVDWNPVVELPPVARNLFNITPSVSLQNVDPGAYWVESERTGGRFVHQSKRVNVGLSAAPTIYGLFPGVGPFARFRHSINPTLSFSYAPAANIDTTYLAAFGHTKAHYLGALRQSAVTLGLTQSLEAKVKPRPGADSTALVPGGTAGNTLKLLSLDVTSLSYDFVRANAVHRASAGFTNSNFGYTLRSDLLPGFNLNVGYSLFQGDPLSDTAVFRPYRDNVAASLEFNDHENPFAVLTRLFGRAVPEAQTAPAPSADQTDQPAEQAAEREYAAIPVAGSRSGGARFIVPPDRGWSASFTYSSSRQRPPVGGTVIAIDPNARCNAIAQGNPFVFQQCLAEIQTNPSSLNPVQSITAGGPVYLIPPQSSLGSNVNFRITPKWTALWQTSYDFQRRGFASQVVSLQRDMHDWRAIFGFTQAPNGNFAFNFSIGLKADGDLKFDYNKSTVRSNGGSF